mmetsp:Transcript_39835/g.101037  ORF Transcript_39835/g.101037 Transcript_39835/m.101037 type:complete len:251 (-) Transcript_39835:32-784(-)
MPGELVRLALHQVHDALEVRLHADGNLHRRAVDLELVTRLLHDLPGVGARAVQLVDEDDARHVVAPHLPVHRDALTLHAAHGAQHQHRAVQHTQRALHLDGEVHVARGVNDIDLLVFPGGVGGGGLDGDALLTLQVHGIHLSAHAIPAADLVDVVNTAGVEQDALRKGRLAGVDMRGDAYVAHVGQLRHLRGLCLRHRRQRTHSRHHAAGASRRRGGAGICHRRAGTQSARQQTAAARQHRTRLGRTEAG